MVSLTASATAGTNVQYQFWLYNPATLTWSQLQAYSPSSTCSWTPTTPGNYLISAAALDGVTGEEVSTTSWYAVVSSVLSAVSLSTSPASPQPCNTAVTLTASATGGTNVQYQFWLYNPATLAWSQLQAYSPSSTCSWTPATPGRYLLSTSARDSVSGQEVSTTSWFTVINPAFAVSLSAAPPSPQPSNTPVTFTAAATGGTNVQYQFWLYNPATVTWTQLQAFSPSPTCSWTTPVTPGSYLISTTAQDGASGQEVSAMLWDQRE